MNLHRRRSLLEIILRPQGITFEDGEYIIDRGERQPYRVAAEGSYVSRNYSASEADQWLKMTVMTHIEQLKRLLVD